MCEKLPGRSAATLSPFEVIMAIILEFLHQYNLPTKKVNFVICVTSEMGENEQWFLHS